MATRRLSSGRAAGVDLWRGVDQSANSPNITWANAGAEGVAGRVELHTADMRALPFADARFDVVLSSLAVHNIRGDADRARAISEAVRVLRPGGRLVIVDIRHVATYQQWLAQHGLTNLHRRRLGWRYWYGGPWVGAELLTGTRPGPDRGGSEARTRGG
jgi:arsenite methyltransferase